MKNVLIILTLLAGMSIFSGCNETDTDAQERSDDKRLVGVSIPPQGTFVEAVGGNLVDTVVTIPPGNSPANYEPSPAEIEAFSNADVYFSIGVPTEQDNILSKAKDLNPEMNIVDLADAVDQEIDPLYFNPERIDRHRWLSPKRVIVMIETIRDELIALDPDHRDMYEQNAADYIGELEDADHQIKEILSEDLSSRTFVIYHPALGYFADDYGLEMIALEQDGKEASPQVMEETIDLAKEKDIKVIFYQQEFDSKQADAFAEEINGISKRVNPLATDYIDNLISLAKTFEDTME